MADILSLSKARKAKARVAKDATAVENRTKFGRSKVERERDAAQKSADKKKIEAHRRDDTSGEQDERPVNSFYDFSAKRLGGDSEKLSDFDGKVALVVNVASHCGNTPQYEGLEALYKKYRDRGLVVLGFPCNQFGEQESGSEAEIAEFCTLNYAVDFPMFGKIEVNGPGADPLYKWMKLETPGSDNRDIEWNFAKFLVGRDGKPVKRFGDKFMPEDIAPEIEKLL